MAEEREVVHGKLARMVVSWLVVVGAGGTVVAVCATDMSYTYKWMISNGIIALIYLFLPRFEK